MRVGQVSENLRVDRFELFKFTFDRSVWLLDGFHRFGLGSCLDWVYAHLPPYYLFCPLLSLWTARMQPRTMLARYGFLFCHGACSRISNCDEFSLRLCLYSQVMSKFVCRHVLRCASERVQQFQLHYALPESHRFEAPIACFMFF